jgi:hypothetical protein
MNGARSRPATRSLKGKVLVLVATISLAAAAPEADARFGGGGFRGGGFGGFRGGGGFHGFGGDGFGGGRFGEGESHGGGGGGLFGGGGSHHGLFGGGGLFSHSSGDKDSGQHSSSGGDSWHPPSDTSETAGEAHPNAGADYQTYHANQQAETQGRYNEANTLQTNRYNEANTIQKNRNNEANYLQSNSNYNPYGDCCNDGGSDVGTALGAAALGTVGGLAIGSAIANNENAQPAPTYNYNNYYSDYSPPPAAPALGTTVYSLPPGAYSTTIDGSTYYVSGSTYYKPFYSGSQVIYVVSRP